MNNEKRNADWRRNAHLETWLKETEALLEPCDDWALQQAGESGVEWPQVFVIGAPRSGTTLLMQWLAASGQFAYPTNLMSRFYAAPAVGARFQHLLNDPALNFRDELSDLTPQKVGYESSLGKTHGSLEPNEFWYWWRRYLPTKEIEPIGARVSEVDSSGLRKSIGSITNVFQKPFAAKGMMLQYDLEHFAETLPKSVFIHVVRDGVSNAESLLRARTKFFGSTEMWYSAKPPEYAELSKGTPEEQVAGQVFYTQKHIDEALSKLPSERSLRIPYSEFCTNPKSFHEQLWERLAVHGAGLGGAFDHSRTPNYTGPSDFRCTDFSLEAITANERLAGLVQAWQSLEQTQTSGGRA